MINHKTVTQSDQKDNWN